VGAGASSPPQAAAITSTARAARRRTGRGGIGAGPRGRRAEHRVRSWAMRARQARLLGRAVVVGWAALLALLAVDAVRTPDHERSSPAATSASAASAFVEAWERSRLGTFVTVGTYQRRSEVTGAEL